MKDILELKGNDLKISLLKYVIENYEFKEEYKNMHTLDKPVDRILGNCECKSFNNCICRGNIFERICTFCGNKVDFGMKEQCCGRNACSDCINIDCFGEIFNCLLCSMVCSCGKDWIRKNRTSCDNPVCIKKECGENGRFIYCNKDIINTFLSAISDFLPESSTKIPEWLYQKSNDFSEVCFRCQDQPSNSRTLLVQCSVCFKYSHETGNNDDCQDDEYWIERNVLSCYGKCSICNKMFCGSIEDDCNKMITEKVKIIEDEDGNQDLIRTLVCRSCEPSAFIEDKQESIE